MYQVEYDPEAERDLASLDSSVAQHILKRLKWLSENALSVKHKPLHQSLAGRSKLRVSDYRVVYTMNRKLQKFRVHLIGHRSQIYKIQLSLLSV